MSFLPDYPTVPDAPLPGEQKVPLHLPVFLTCTVSAFPAVSMGNKPVGTVNEFSLYDLSILHVKFPILNSIRSPTFDTAFTPPNCQDSAAYPEVSRGRPPHAHSIRTRRSA